MTDGTILIFTALDFEARPIARELGLRFTSRSAARGILPNGLRVLLQIVGPGAGHLPAQSPAEGTCRVVIMAGVAGGLAPELKRGDIVVDDQSTCTDLDATLSRRGPFASVDAILATPADKADLHRSTGALVVDMENAVVRAWACGHGLPFLGIRAVSDTAEETLDPALARAVDRHGFLRPHRLIGELLRRPTLASSLWRLRSSGQVVETLARQIHGILRQIPARE